MTASTASTPTPGPMFDVEALVKLRRVTSVAVSPCGTWAAAAVQRLNHDGSKYLSDLWRLPLDGGAPSQLTRGASSDSAPCFRADGALGFLSNRADGDAAPDAASDGNAGKRKQVWLLPAAGGEPLRLTDEPLGVDQFKFAKRGDCLAVLAPVLPQVPHAEQRKTADRTATQGPSALRYTAMPVRLWDTWLPTATTHLVAYDSQGGTRRDLTPDARRELLDTSFDVSPDGGQIVASWATPGADRVDDCALVLFDCAGGAPRVLASESLLELTHPVFCPEGKTVACAVRRRIPQRCVRTSLALVDVEEGGHRPCAAGWDAWPTPAAWSADGRTLYATADESACTPVFGIDLASGAATRLTEGGTHSGVTLAPDGSLLGIRSAHTHPPEMFHLPAGGAGGRGFGALTLPHGLSGFDPACVPFELENLSVTSTDGTPIQYFLLKPAGHQGAPLPSLLWIHGGPMHAWSDSWHWRWCPLTAVAQGYAVILPNPRGSTGFGQAFIDGIWGNTWGKQCYEDVMAVADQVQARPEIDGGRMAAMGGSFGGYMSNWIGTQTDRFRCIITHASVYSMSAFTGVTDMPAFWMLMQDGSHYTDPKGFDRYSPSSFVAQWKTPTLVIHGDLDYRVPVGEGLALFEALQYHGVESELLVFPDENHWIVKPNNCIAWYQAVFEYLGRYLDRSLGR